MPLDARRLHRAMAEYTDRGREHHKSLMCSTRRRVALFGIPGFHASLEPQRPLRRSSVGKAFGLDMTRGHLLQTIVANGRSRLQRFLGIARLELDPSRSQSSA